MKGWDREKGYYFVYVPSSWLANNWADSLNANKAITIWSSCYSANYTEGTAVMDAAGGRWRVGYQDESWTDEQVFVNGKFLMRMNGTAGIIVPGSRRTAGEAWEIGTGYEYPEHYTGIYRFNVRMRGNEWTTLCPAPMANNSTYPASASGKKGYGCVIFDTYMNDEIPAKEALKKVSGGPTSNHRWDGSAEEKFILGFDYDNTGYIPTTMRVVGDRCRNADPYGGRGLDVNRVAPNSTDKKSENLEWSY